MITYGKFWPRVGAAIIDGFIIAPVGLAFSYINFSSVRSFWLFLIPTLAVACYKPLLEHYYQATVGKMALKLKVTDVNYNRIDLSQSFVRSIFNITPTLIQIPFYYLGFQNPNLLEADGFWSFAALMAGAYPLMSILSNIMSFAGLADILFIFGDSEKKERTLHDRIAKTYVITNDSKIENIIDEIGVDAESLN